MKTETNRLYSDIRKDYNKLVAVKQFGVQKYSNDFIMAKLAHDYYKQPKTIENILYNRYTPVINQLQLFEFTEN